MSSYEGLENYIFVSYAHKDSAVVVPIIETLQREGFRIWYDSGIEAGTEWPAYIESHLKKCAAVLVFISPASIDSVNCRNEVNMACMIHKKMLIAYLQDTELAHGMLLQLSALQSIYRNRHPDTASFVNALMASQVLSCCKIGYNESDEDNTEREPRVEFSTVDLNTVLRSGDLHLIKESRINAPPGISKVGSMGSRDTENAWPIGTYSTVIDIDRYSVIYFHAHLVRPIKEAGSLSVGLLIFDSENTLVYENISDLDFKVGYDRVSKSWVVRDSSGMAQSTGDYTALIFVGNSRMFEYKFSLISSSDQRTSAINNSLDTQNTAIRDEKNKKISSLKAKLAYPKMFLSILAMLVSFMAFIWSTNNYSPIISIVFFIAYALFFVRSYRLTNEHLIKSKLLSLLVVLLGSFYYLLIIFIMMLCTFGKRSELKKSLAELSDGAPLKN